MEKLDASRERRADYHGGGATPVRILVGHDGSEGARAAVRDLARAGLPDQGHALVVTIADVVPAQPVLTEMPVPPVFPGARMAWEEALEQARTSCAQAGQLVSAILPRWTVETLAIADSPARGLVAAAEQRSPDLVVVGAHDISLTRRIAFGSVSSAVVRNAPCSVRVGRPSARPMDGPPRLLVGIDGSSHSLATVAAVARRPWPPGTAATVMLVEDAALRSAVVATPDPFLMGWVREDDEHEQAWVRRALDAAADALRAGGVEAVPVVERGDPKHVLVAQAEQLGVDALFVGAKGMRAIERFLVGSVSAAVASRAPCSVEVVRAPG